jgi:hypothetical protein
MVGLQQNGGVLLTMWRFACLFIYLFISRSINETVIAITKLNVVCAYQCKESIISLIYKKSGLLARSVCMHQEILALDTGALLVLLSPSKCQDGS